MYDAVLRLRDHGHRRIGFVGGASEYNFSHLREDGFRKGMAAADLPCDETLIAPGAMLRHEGQVKTEAMLRSNNPQTAIVFGVDLAASGAYDAARNLGLNIGRDFSII